MRNRDGASLIRPNNAALRSDTVFVDRVTTNVTPPFFLMRRRGLTLVELLIAIVLLGIIGAGITRLLSSQLRFFASRTARAYRSGTNGRPSRF